MRKTAAWRIDDKIDFLIKNLPNNPTSVQSLYVLPEKWRNFESLQEISNHIGYYLGLFKKVKVNLIGPQLKYDFNINRRQNPRSKVVGHYKVISPDHSEITIDASTIYRISDILAILAHEYTHNYLFHFNLSYRDESENEILTDVSTVFLGLGSLLLDGYRSNDISTLGYISYEDILYTFAQVAEIRQWHPDHIKANLPTEQDFENLKIYLKPYITSVKQRENFFLLINSMQGEIKLLLEKLDSLVEQINTLGTSIQNKRMSRKEGQLFVDIMSEITTGNLHRDLKSILLKLAVLNSSSDQDMSTFKELAKEVKNKSKILDKWQHVVTKYL